MAMWTRECGSHNLFIYFIYLGKIRVIYAEEFDHPNPEDIADICFDLHHKYQNTRFFVDGANRATTEG
jgi:hypothetical protein